MSPLSHSPGLGISDLGQHLRVLESFIAESPPNFCRVWHPPAMDESGNDDVLELVLERVDSHVSLIRAAAVCKRWRRAIADAAFLRRYRSLHAPAVAGGYGYGVGDRRSRVGPVFAPSSPSVVDARHFSLDFLPGGAASWIVQDSRSSLLLLCHWEFQVFPSFFPDMVVCEPLTRHYRRIHPPADLADVRYFWQFCLIDGEADEVGGHISLSNFRVLCMFICRGFMHTAMLSTGSTWSEKNICHAAPNFYSTNYLGRAGGSRYFCVEGRTLVNLDCSTGDFMSSALPAIEDLDFDQETCNFFVTELRDGKPHIITMFRNTVKVFTRLDSGEWVLAKSVMLPEVTHRLPGYKASFFDSGQDILVRGPGFVILSPQSESWLSAESWKYSLDLETMEAELATCDLKPIVYRCELPWPPALHAHLDR
ncbi:unnamed protein product [Urochloa decumbens]|uniref:F-box domain-containing protein n=2 Tax=Urochloa decumbens TaxID=240449 RepID=A0ABC8VID6_9POAL